MNRVTEWNATQHVEHCLANQLDNTPGQTAQRINNANFVQTIAPTSSSTPSTTVWHLSPRNPSGRADPAMSKSESIETTESREDSDQDLIQSLRNSCSKLENRLRDPALVTKTEREIAQEVKEKCETLMSVNKLSAEKQLSILQKRESQEAQEARVLAQYVSLAESAKAIGIDSQQQRVATTPKIFTRVAAITATAMMTLLYVQSIQTNFRDGKSLPAPTKLMAGVFLVPAAITTSQLTLGENETDAGLQSIQNGATAVKDRVVSTAIAVKNHVTTYPRFYKFFATAATAAVTAGVVRHFYGPQMMSGINAAKNLFSTRATLTAVNSVQEVETLIQRLGTTTTGAVVENLELYEEALASIRMIGIPAEKPAQEESRSLLERMTRGTILPSIASLVSHTFNGVMDYVTTEITPLHRIQDEWIGTGHLAT